MGCKKLWIKHITNNFCPLKSLILINFLNFHNGDLCQLKKVDKPRPS